MRSKNIKARWKTKWAWYKKKWDRGETWRKDKREKFLDWLTRFLDWLIRHLDQLIAIFIIAFILVMFIPWLSELIGCLLGTSNKKETLTFMGLGIGGLVLWKRATSAEKHAGAMVKTNEITEIGHAQERLKTSIEHLGNKEKSVRIGAAYELYHLATDREVYKETICDILCGHIRQMTQEAGYQKTYTNRPSEEIQTFLNLLCGKEKGHIFNSHQRDLSSSFLRGHQSQQCIAHQHQRDLSSSFLRGANLWMAHLQSANLQGAQLQGADLWRAQLQRTILREAQLQGAILWRARLHGAELREAQLQGAILEGAQMQGANLLVAQLQGANLVAAQLQGATLEGAQMQGANLVAAQMQGAHLVAAQLQRARLEGAQMQGANLQGAQLQGANLQGAQLQGVASSLCLYPLLDFQNPVRDRIGQDSDFTNVIFSGGLSADQVEKIIASIPPRVVDFEKEKLKSRLSEHIGQAPSNKLHTSRGAITGKYSKEDAERWIKEYDKAMESVPKKRIRLR